MKFEDRMALKHKVNLLYDFQRLRIQAAGRTNNPKNQVQLSEKDKIFLGKVGSDLDLIETAITKEVVSIVKGHPLWQKYLIDMAGIAEKSAGVLISTIDIEKANTPSALWMYSGLGVVPHVICTKCEHKSWHNKGVCQKSKGTKKNYKVCGGVVEPILDDSGEAIRGRQRLVKGERAGYNKWLKSKLLGVIVPNLLKKANPIRLQYDNYKNRLIATDWGKSSPGTKTKKSHQHKASLRYLAKMFELELWKKWREIEGLPVREAYAVEYLGKHKH